MDRAAVPGSTSLIIKIRPASAADSASLWAILEPTIRAAETYTLPHDMTREEALAWWLSPGHEVFIAAFGSEIAGTYFLRANQKGGGSHVANCGYITAPHFRGRGVARAMCEHSLEQARERGFRAMQFNFVVSTNTRAVALWESLGFQTIGRIPEAFRHPAQGFVDALIMYRQLPEKGIAAMRR